MEIDMEIRKSLPSEKEQKQEILVPYAELKMNEQESNGLRYQQLSEQQTFVPPSQELKYQPLKEEQTRQDESSKDIDKMIIKSDFLDVSAEKLPAEVVKAFNKTPQNIIVEPSVVRSSDRIDPDQYFLAHKNKVPQIALGEGKRLAVKWNANPNVQIEKIAIVSQTAPIFGAYGVYVINVPPGQYAKAWSNNHPILLGEGIHVRHDSLFRFDKNHPDPVASFHAETHFVDQSKNYIHHGNIHIIRVLPGKFAAIVLNGKPELLPPSKKPYVFETPLFQFDPDRNFIDQSENYIAHGNFHQLRIPPGKLAKVTINNLPQLLAPTEDNKPYIIDTPSFRFDPARDFVNATENYIRHETMHFVRVPPGQFAKVIVDGIPKLLGPTTKDKPHEFRTANFIFDPSRDYVDQSTPYIKHGVRHILRIPKGAVAKAWYGNKPVLLEKKLQDDKDDVLDFEDPQFRLEEVKKDGRSYQFVNADEKLIVHGSIKRVITPINQLAILNKNGKIDIVEGSYITDSPSESVVGFFDTSVQTLEFPSKRTKEKRAAERTTINDRIIYDVYTTSDSVEVGLKLLVAFRVPDVESAKLALTRFSNMDNIAEHIEGVVRSDMTKIIKTYTSQKFSAANEPQNPLSNGYQKEQKHYQMPNDSRSFVSDQAMTDSAPMPFAPSIVEQGPSAPPPSKTYLEQAEAILGRHLQTCGIELIRMTIEESKILDIDLTKKMSEQALTTAKTNADLAIVEQKATIAQAQAEQDKAVAIIQQSQINDSKVKAAQSVLQAAEFESQALERRAKADALKLTITAQAESEKIKMTADADSKRIMLIAGAEAKAIELKGAAQNDILQQQAKFYEENPRLFELEMAKAKFGALTGLRMTVTSKEFSNLYNIPGLSMFGLNPERIALDEKESKQQTVLPNLKTS